eukprot:161838-Prorocentrum_minimum.AAC.2
MVHVNVTDAPISPPYLLLPRIQGPFRENSKFEVEGVVAASDPPRPSGQKCSTEKFQLSEV